MMHKLFLPCVFSFGLILAVATAQEIPPKWAGAALVALPPKFTGQVLQITGDKGTPEPAQWVIYARVRDDDDSSPSTVHTLVVANGQVVSDNRSANLLQVFRNNGYIAAPDLQTDSGDAFLTLTMYATANNKIVNTVNYKLVRNSNDAAPIWTLTAFDPAGGEIGWLKISAADGSVIGQRGFPNAPATN